MRKISCFGWWVLIFAMIFSGCGGRKGQEPKNSPPQVFFANIPPESLRVSVSPRIYWYGTDEDGYITAYQYAVIRDSLIKIWGGLDAAKDSLEKIKADSASWINNTTRMGIFGVPIEAEGGHQANVRMYAEVNPDSFAVQYIFLRAVDNAGGASEIKIRMYSRNNHPPQCAINVDNTFVSKSFYCLPETTQTWKGIELNWVGYDTLDYPDKRKQPDFYFKWELWGPYKDTSSFSDPTATKVRASLDSIQIGGEWIRDEWATDKSYVFKNLENYPGRGYGWYHLRVWSRDDAFVSSKDSATTFLRILKPLFRYEQPSQKSILVLDVTKYGQIGAVADSLKVLSFYRDTLLSQGHICDRFNVYPLGDKVPSEDSLSRYDLIIVLNLGREIGISEDDYTKFKEYLNVGGRLWIIGLNNYGFGGDRRKFCMKIDITASKPNTRKVATEYLGLDCVFYPNWGSGFPDRLEFLGAEPFGSWGLPSLEMNPDKVKELPGYNPSQPGTNFGENGIPHVSCDILSSSLDFDKRAPLQRRLYSFVSRRGLDSEEMHLMPCATTYIGPTFRTAEFTFPLNLMKNPAATEAFKKMVEWFWQGLPLP